MHTCPLVFLLYVLVCSGLTVIGNKAWLLCVLNFVWRSHDMTFVHFSTIPENTISGSVCACAWNLVLSAFNQICMCCWILIQSYDRIETNVFTPWIKINSFLGSYPGIFRFSRWWNCWLNFRVPKEKLL